MVRDETRFANAVGRIRVLERKMMDKGKLERLMDARGPDEALKILQEAGYETDDGSNTAWDYERILDNRMKGIYDYLKKISPDPDIIDLFLYRQDFHNAKVILKSLFKLPEEGKEIRPFICYGTIPADELEKCINERKLNEIPSFLRGAVDECFESFGKKNDPQEIDIILDNAMFRQMSSKAADIRNDFIIKLVRIMVDLVNIKTFIRLKIMNKPLSFFQRVLFDYGTIPVSSFMTSIEKPLESILEGIKLGPYTFVCEEGLDGYFNNESLAKLELLSDNYIMSFIKQAKYIALGPEPLIAYLLAYENEIKNIRIIMIGKTNKIPNDIIAERLRDMYV